ncbi:MAG: hypothetical protein ACR2GU_11470 [Rubrobacteraceae bacterium]
MDEKKTRGDVRAGMVWGGIGGVAGFLVSLLGSLLGILASGFIGVYCGRRAARTSEERAGALAGLVGGAIAAPPFVLGASAGALVAARGLGAARIAATFSEVTGTRISPQDAWEIYLISIALSAVLQAGILIAASAAAGAWVARRG